MTVLQFFTGHPERWIKGSLNNGKGQHCLVGALYHCYPTGDFNANAKRALAYNRLSLMTGGSPVNFNDARETTFDDVLKVVEQANV